VKIYIAAPFAARDIGVLAAQQLQRAGHECTSSWLLSTRSITDTTIGASWDTSDEVVREHALGDLDDIKRADAVIHLTAEYALEHGAPDLRLHTGGRHVEVGFALAAGKIVVSVGIPENVFQRGLCHNVHTFSDAIKAVEAALFARRQAMEANRSFLISAEYRAQLEELLGDRS
jgi:hypothetical protein